MPASDDGGAWITAAVTVGVIGSLIVAAVIVNNSAPRKSLEERVADIEMSLQHDQRRCVESPEASK